MSREYRIGFSKEFAVVMVAMEATKRQEIVNTPGDNMQMLTS
jgi:hypothetical protein